MTVAMPSHQRKGKCGVVNTQVQSHPLLRRRFGTSVPFIVVGRNCHEKLQKVLGINFQGGLTFQCLVVH